jgi:DNA gyrase subunit A
LGYRGQSGNFLALMGRPKYDDSIDTIGESMTPLVPLRFNLRQALDCFLDFRFLTVRKKARAELVKVESRANIVDGLLLALHDVDKVIDIIRVANDTKAAKDAISSTLGTNVKQTEAILNLQLGQLTRLNKDKLDQEMGDIRNSRQRLSSLLSLNSAVYDTMIEDFESLAKEFGIDRRSRILSQDEKEVDSVKQIPNNPSIIVVTGGGYIKRMPLQTFEIQKRGTRGKQGASITSTNSAKYTTDVNVAHCFTCKDQDTLLMLTHSGIAYSLPAHEIPVFSRQAKGQSISSVLGVSTDVRIT